MLCLWQKWVIVLEGGRAIVSLLLGAMATVSERQLPIRLRFLYGLIGVLFAHSGSRAMRERAAWVRAATIDLSRSQALVASSCALGPAA